jgi:hypothetical protein
MYVFRVFEVPLDCSKGIAPLDTGPAVGIALGTQGQRQEEPKNAQHEYMCRGE